MKIMTEELWRKAILQLSMTEEEREFVKQWVDEWCAEISRLATATKDSCVSHRADRQDIAQVCRFCGVLPQYGHLDWCKVTRAPTAEEVLRALIEENERSVDEGPSEDLTAMARACLRG